jgi:hypothetical protein
MENPLFAWLKICRITEVLNIITWSHAYALLPYPLFILHRTYLPDKAVQNSRQRFANLLEPRSLMPDIEVEPIDIRDAQNTTVHLVQ